MTPPSTFSTESLLGYVLAGLLSALGIGCWSTLEIVFSGESSHDR